MTLHIILFWWFRQPLGCNITSHIVIGLLKFTRGLGTLEIYCVSDKTMGMRMTMNFCVRFWMWSLYCSEEVVEIIMRTRWSGGQETSLFLIKASAHTVNLVRLLAFCLEVIYEFLPNKSLDWFLLDLWSAFIFFLRWYGWWLLGLS